jgi:hypothetical protein
VGSSEQDSVSGLGEREEEWANRLRADAIDTADPPAELCAGADDAAAAEDPAEAPAEEDMAVGQ